jgi:hypothetical protein
LQLKLPEELTVRVQTLLPALEVVWFQRTLTDVPGTQPEPRITTASPDPPVFGVIVRYCNTV